MSKYKVDNMIKKAKTKSGVPGNLTKILNREFCLEQAVPAGKLPDNWKVEFGLPLKKTTNQITEDYLTHPPFQHSV